GPGYRVSASANPYRALGFGWIIGESCRCPCEFFLHLSILLRMSQKNIALAEARHSRNPLGLRHLTGTAPRSALRAEPTENEFAFTKNPLTEGARGRSGYVVPLHVLNIAAAGANEVVMH